MKTSLIACFALGIAFASLGAHAQAPAGAIAQCKDGTYFTGTSHKGACKGHQGVKSWLDKASQSGAAAATDQAGSTAAKSKSKSSMSSAGAKSTAAATAAPAGAIARCKDGTYFTGTSHKGACRGHKGVADWLDKTSAAATGTSPPAAPPPVAPAPAPKPATSAAPAAAPTAATAPARTPPTPASQIQQKAGGGPGMVWVNSSTKVYHCQGDEWYGKTKEGSYMTEAQAKAAGNHAARGKECGG